MKRSPRDTLWQAGIRIHKHALISTDSASRANQTTSPRRNSRNRRWPDDQPQAGMIVNAERFEGDARKAVAVMPCRCRPLVLRREELHPRALRRVTCAHGIWALELFGDAQAAWTLVWSEPTLRYRRGLGRWLTWLGVGR